MRATFLGRAFARALVLAVAAVCGSLLMAGVANADPQSVTMSGANPTNGYSINLGPYSSCYENGGFYNYCPSLTVQDATAEWLNPSTSTWQAAYDVGIHPWGEVSGTNSWINCGPSLVYCVSTTATYRVRFTVPSDWSNPTLTLTARADNILSVTLNGNSLISNAVGGNGFETTTVTPSLSAGVNELRFIVTDQGGIAGFNYKAVLDYDASSGSAVIGAGDPTPATGCEPGTYSATGGEPCQSAPAGTFVSGSWATSATACPAGTYSSSPGSSSCTEAPAGYFVSGSGASSAAQCPPGTYSASSGSSSCTDAPAGYYVSGSGATSATECGPGTYSASAGASSCTQASPGSYVAGSGATSATYCSAGTYSASAGSSSCTQAPAETFVDTVGADAALPCPADSTTNGLTGQTRCVQIPPTIALQSVSPAANGNGWNNGPVTVTWTCTHSTKATVSVVLSDDGANQSATGTCIGGFDATKTVSDTKNGISIDQTKPDVSYSGNAGTYSVDQTVAITCSASDAGGSGIDANGCPGVSGPAWSFGLGGHTFAVTATDNAGNSSTAYGSFTVTADATSLCALVHQFVANHGIANSLCAKLDAAAAAAARGQAKTQANVLGAFDSEVRAQTGKALTAEHAAALVAFAARL